MVPELQGDMHSKLLLGKKGAHACTQIARRVHHVGHTIRSHRLVPRSSAQDSITDVEAERFEKIAAALVEKLKLLPAEEAEPEGMVLGY